MAVSHDLHQRLIALQPEAELKRKADKSTTRSNLWTQEEIDHADRVAERWSRFFHPLAADLTPDLPLEQ